jgi:hypothetical protein
MEKSYLTDRDREVSQPAGVPLTIKVFAYIAISMVLGGVSILIFGHP